jgi:hypothetical protein
MIMGYRGVRDHRPHDSTAGAPNQPASPPWDEAPAGARPETAGPPSASSHREAGGGASPVRGVGIDPILDIQTDGTEPDDAARTAPSPASLNAASYGGAAAWPHGIIRPNGLEFLL